MKTNKFIVSSMLLISSVFACTNDWDSHYSQEDQVVDNEHITIVNGTAIDYLKSQPDLSTMYQLFNETGILDEMVEKNLLFTIFVVNNSNAASLSTDDKEFFAKSHLSDVSLSPSNLTNGKRLLMWNGKYVSVAMGEGNDVSSISFNGSTVTKITKVNDGYIYELGNFVETPKSLYEMIAGLGDEYSIFREAVMSRNQNTFDRENSRITGVDNTGSSLYDSTFVVTNPYFESQGFNLMSESLTATVLIPSNEVINRALATARQSLASWNMQREDSIIENWTFQSAFFNQKYTKADFEANVDLTSVFKKQWRTTVQRVDLDNPVALSNGVAYYVTDMKIPDNVLIFRVKDFMKWYEYLTEEEKAEYYVSDNLVFDKVNTDVGAWSGWPGVFPTIENRCLYFKLADTTNPEFSLDFTGLRYDATSRVATPYTIPPGEYDLCLGFKQNLGYDVEVSFNGGYVGTVTTSQLTSTTFHYDRGGQGYPEGYDTSKATDGKKGNYDRDGGRVGLVTIGGTQPVEVHLQFHVANTNDKGIMFHHWCLKPTSNCY